MWQVQAILKTPADGVSKVVVLVGDKTGKQKPQVLAFYYLPDGKHIISGDDIINFGANPFADARQQLQQHANGPYRGAAPKDLELVEFADFQCPHCKEAEANMDKLVTDYPKARIVFENFPIPTIHPQSMLAAEYGVCVTKLGGSSAFFQFAAAVFDGQDGLATADGAALTLNSATAKAGLDPAKVAACAATPEVKANVDASIQLGKDLGVAEVPTLMVNGRPVAATAPYDSAEKDHRLPGQDRRRQRPVANLKGPEFLAPAGIGEPGPFWRLRNLFCGGQSSQRASRARRSQNWITVAIESCHQLAINRGRARASQSAVGLKRQAEWCAPVFHGYRCCARLIAHVVLHRHVSLRTVNYSARVLKLNLQSSGAGVRAGHARSRSKKKLFGSGAIGVPTEERAHHATAPERSAIIPWSGADAGPGVRVPSLQVSVSGPYCGVRVLAPVLRFVSTK